MVLRRPVELARVTGHLKNAPKITCPVTALIRPPLKISLCTCRIACEVQLKRDADSFLSGNSRLDIADFRRSCVTKIALLRIHMELKSLWSIDANLHSLTCPARALSSVPGKVATTISNCFPGSNACPGRGTARC